MKQIFDSNSRIEKINDGIKFYEQDILSCSYVFEDDLIIDLDIDYILENGKYDNHTKKIIWENLSTDKLQFEFNNIEDDWMNFSGIVNICLVDKI